MTKYRLSEEAHTFTYQIEGRKKSVLLRQIIAVADFNDVKAGTPGGWVDNESVVSQQGQLLDLRRKYDGVCGDGSYR
nr:transferase [Salmonella sp. NCTC 7297]